MRPLLITLGLLGAATAHAGDYLQWRGPKQSGEVTGAKLPDAFELDKVGEGGLLWKAPVGGRAAPLLMDGKLYILNGFDNRLPTEAERVSCIDAKTGKVLWNYVVNVYHADVVTSRLGWTTVAGDPVKKRVYTHTTGGELLCLDDQGNKVWSRQLTEEFGRFTGYGGRIVSPTFDSGLVIVAIVNSSWGDMAKGSNRFLAFNGDTGAVEWIADPDPVNTKGTYQSTPVVAVINGQRLLVAGGASGAIHGMKVRTGELVFSYPFSDGAINPSPIVSGTLVYGAHGEENPEGGSLGRVVCFDAAKIDPKTKKPKLVWEYRQSNRFGLSHPALADGRLYVPDDSSELFCFNAKTGKLLWKYKYGTNSRGAPLIVDNKLYIFDVNAKLVVLKLQGDRAPTFADAEEYTFRLPEGETGFNETQGTPIAADGRLYFTTSFDTYCVGDPDAKPGKPFELDLPPETPYDPAAKPAAARISPFEQNGVAGGTVSMRLVPIDANGRDLPVPEGARPEWAIVQGPVPKGASAAPPALAGELKPDGASALITLGKVPGQGGYVEAKLGNLKARARVRVVPTVPYINDFEKVPEGAVPGGWVNTAGKFEIKKLEGGNKVLAKKNTDARPPLARANGYFTLPESTGYDIQCDLYATEVGGKLPDMGIIASRYTLSLDGKTDPTTDKRTIRLTSWDARPRVNVLIPYQWMPGTWYSAKLVVKVGDKTAKCYGKVWPRASKSRRSGRYNTRTLAPTATARRRCSATFPTPPRRARGRRSTTTT